MSTPQDVALADVRKGIAMFRKVGVPVRLLNGLRIMTYTNMFLLDHRSCIEPVTLLLFVMRHAA